MPESQANPSLEERLERIEAGVNQVRKYLFWGFVFQLGTILLPILLILLALPWMISTLTSATTLGL